MVQNLLIMNQNETFTVLFDYLLQVGVEPMKVLGEIAGSSRRLRGHVNIIPSSAIKIASGVWFVY